MGVRVAILAAVFGAAAMLSQAGCGNGTDSPPVQSASGEPNIAIVSPRNGARQTSRAVVVKVKVHNFRIAPEHFGGEPRLREGHLQFSLNRVPDCVDPVKLQRAEQSPVGRGRLIGASFDFPRYAGPNGVLAARIGTSGSYSPATRPEIFYHELPTGFYRLVIALAQNNDAPTPYHSVTNFQILPPPGQGAHPCRGGKVSSAKAAVFE
jgi:hypothetical protein